MAEPAVAKLCTVCGIDCSGKPRIKDQQGRYICKECFDKAKQTRQTQKNPAPAAAGDAGGAGSDAPAEGDNSFLLGIGKASSGLQGTKPCPECGRAMGTDAVVCIGCGYNATTGKRHVVKVVKTKQKAEKVSSGGGGAVSGFFQNGPLLGFIIFLIHAGSAAALLVEPSMGLAMLLVSALVALAVWIATIVAALRENKVWGIICIIPLMAAVWGLFMTEDSRFKSIWGGHILGSIARAVIATFIVAGSGN
jgi:hypothetical protein